MRRVSVVVIGMTICVGLLSGCGDDGSVSQSGSDLPPEAAAAVDEYLRTVNEGDVEGYLAIINEAVYLYVFNETTSFPADIVAGKVANGEFVVERQQEIAVELDHTVSARAYVAFSAVRPLDPTAVNGIMVLEIQEYPDRGWLITLDHRFGL